MFDYDHAPDFPPPPAEILEEILDEETKLRPSFMDRLKRKGWFQKDHATENKHITTVTLESVKATVGYIIILDTIAKWQRWEGAGGEVPGTFWTETERPSCFMFLVSCPFAIDVCSHAIVFSSKLGRSQMRPLFAILPLY